MAAEGRDTYFLLLGRPREHTLDRPAGLPGRLCGFAGCRAGGGKGVACATRRRGERGDTCDSIGRGSCWGTGRGRSSSRCLAMALLVLLFLESLDVLQFFLRPPAVLGHDAGVADAGFCIVRCEAFQGDRHGDGGNIPVEYKMVI
jgi:hypothetical protein